MNFGMDKAIKGNLSITNTKLISMQSKKSSPDNIKISDLCFLKNESTQNQVQNKPQIIKEKENNQIYLKTQKDESRITSIEQNIDINKIQKQQQIIENQNKNSMLMDYLKNTSSSKPLQVNSKQKSTIQNRVQNEVNLKLPNKVCNILQQQTNKNIKSHLKNQKLSQDRARSNLDENNQQKKVLVTNSVSPQPRNNLNIINTENLKQQQIQTFSYRDNKKQQPKMLGDKKLYLMGEKNDLIKFGCQNQKKQRNVSEQMQPIQLLTLINQNKFSTLQRQKQDFIIDLTKIDREQSHDEFMEEQRSDKNQLNHEIQNNQIYFKQNYFPNFNENYHNNEINKKESPQDKTNESLLQQNTINKSKERKNNSIENGSKYKLKDMDVQKFSLLFLQQQKKQFQKGSNKQSFRNPKNDQNTQHSETQDETLIKSSKYPQLNTLIQQLQTTLSKKSPDHIISLDNQEKQIPQDINLQIKSERFKNESNKAPNLTQYGRTSNREMVTQYKIEHDQKQSDYLNTQETQPKQQNALLNSKQQIIEQYKSCQDEENLLKQQLSQPLLTSSSSNKEPNRRYEKQTFDKKNEIDKKIKDYLESKQQNTSQDLSTHQQIATASSIITTSIYNNIKNMNNKSSNSNNLLNSNLLNSNYQYLSKENSIQPSSNCNNLQVNDDTLEESQIHFFTEDPFVCHTIQGSNSKKSNIQKQNSQGQQIQISNHNNIQSDLNSNNTPHRQKNIQLKSSINCQIITPSTCDGKQQVTVVSPQISNFIISSSSKIISVSPKPYLTVENEEIEDNDMVISFSENVNTEESKEFTQFQNTQINEQKIYELSHNNQKVYETLNNNQFIINNKLEQRLEVLEVEMSSILSRCVNLEAKNKSLKSNIEKVNFEKDIIMKENDIYILKIEELSMINKQQKETISKLLTRIHHQQTQNQTYLNISGLQAKQNRTDFSKFNDNTENLTIDTFSSARETHNTSHNTLKAKKEMNQYFSNMMNYSQSKQILPQTFQGYLSQKNLSNFDPNSSIQNKKFLSQND